MILFFFFKKQKTTEVEVSLQRISILAFLGSYQEQSNISLSTKNNTYPLEASCFSAEIPLPMPTNLKLHSKVHLKMFEHSEKTGSKIQGHLIKNSF